VPAVRRVGPSARPPPVLRGVVTGDVPAIVTGTNVDLVHAATRLGYLREADRVVDLTYGRGAWWRKGAPPDLTKITPPTDFRATGLPPSSFDVVCFDGPYRLNGTPDLGDFDERYGINEVMSWQEKHQLLRDGIDEGLRLLRGREGRRRGGLLWVKCQDQVCSGQVRWQTREFAAHAEGYVHEAAGMTRRRARLVDMFHLVRPVRPQPPGRRQVHARRNYSSLLILEKL